ncbi:MAG: IPT/TIG domain-containing protein [Deltaproteobacteria bacterium]|nr:IPT/TIG domain-containing protein [Deltaproteobacteria bacterium]
MSRLPASCAAALLSFACATAFVPGCAVDTSAPVRLQSKTKKPTTPPKTPAKGNEETGGVPTKGEPAPPTEQTPQPDPAPTLSGVTPDAITLGTAPVGGVDVTITGTRFAAGIEIDLAGDRVPTNVSGPTSLTARIPSAKLQTSGVYRLALVKGAAQSNAMTFTVANPTSVLVSSLTPASATVGLTTPLTLSVTGTGFVPASIVRFNGATLATTFKSATSLDATIPAATLVDAGKFSVTVSNAVDVVSMPTSFEVRNPTPTTTSLTPATVTEGAAATAVTINGSGFTKASEVLASGTPLATTYLGATQLRVTLPATMLATARTLSLVVQTPAPGGGTTNGRTFTVAAAGATSSSGGVTPNPNCLYLCDDYGYDPGQCFEGWLCIETGTYAGCLGQTSCN